MLTPGGVMGGRYRLQQRIATGGMGDVWKCEDAVLGRAVALKVLQPAMLQEPGFVQRFRAEARVMATINHPGVVSVHDYGETPLPGGGSVAYLVMEHVEGKSLHDVLVKLGRIAPDMVMDLTAQAADALQAAHDHGIVHRDVKPGNLLVRPNGALVLVDFGIARSALSGNLTQAGVILGTASYVSPEQASGGGSITPASDIYSLGVVAYQCLAGRRPFEGENPIDVALKHVREQPPPLPPDVPENARAVVTRAMAKDAAARWPDARTMGEAAWEAAETRPISSAGLNPTLIQPPSPAPAHQSSPAHYQRPARQQGPAHAPHHQSPAHHPSAPQRHGPPHHPSPARPPGGFGRGAASVPAMSPRQPEVTYPRTRAYGEVRLRDRVNMIIDGTARVIRVAVRLWRRWRSK
ncbi:MAG: protein kinase domain-containing protein [Micromonosporaceae bacterium]